MSRPPLSPRAIRPASLQNASYFDVAQYDSNPALNIDLDANDPYMGQPDPYQAMRSPPPQTDYSGRSYTPAYTVADEDQQDDRAVEQLLLQQQQLQSHHPPAASYAQPYAQPYDAPEYYPQPQQTAYDPVQYIADLPSKEKVDDNNSLYSASGKSFDSAGDDAAPTAHFGPVPTGRLLRRNKTKKRVALTHGNLVLDCPIPSRLNGFLPRKDAEEFRCATWQRQQQQWLSR